VDAAKRKSGLGVQILEKANVFPEKAASGDALKVHYTGKLKATGEVFEETFKVGRPLDVKLGTGSVVKGWDEGLVGMCVGETRRLTVPPKLGYGESGNDKVPPGSTMIFEIKLVALNGKFIHQIEAEGMKQEEEETNDADLILAHRIGEADSPYCDACNTVVEEFYEAWLLSLKGQNDKVQTKDGGSSAPSLTYNDETEAMVQSFCTNATVSRISRKNIYKSHVKPACERIMLGHKREIVGKFLATELHGRAVPDKKDFICNGMVAVCPSSKGNVVGGECQMCRATMQDIAYEVRRGHLANQAKAERQVRDVLQRVCAYTYYRHRQKGGDLQEACDDLVDEHTNRIVKEVLGGISGENSWKEIERTICVDVAGKCPAAIFRKDEL